MSSHYLPELKNMKTKLSKLLGNAQGEEEAINDLLNAIERMPLTAGLINDSGLGPTVKSISKKFSADTALHKRSINILKTWKSIIESSKNDTAAAAPSQSKTTPKTPAATTTQQQPANAQKDSAGIRQNQQRRSYLSSDRLAIFQNIFNAFKQDVSETEAEHISLDIEETLHKSCTDKEYSTKARTLMFNMKKNEALRRNIESKAITPEQLLTMTPAQLASQEVKEARAKMLDEDLDGRRMHWLDDHKAEIQKDLGIDPSNNWNYDGDDDRLSEPDLEPPDE